jgi:hypothetical protein
MHPTDAPPMGSGYVKVVSIISIYLFYKCQVVDWKMLVLDKNALSSEESQPTDLDISLSWWKLRGKFSGIGTCSRLHVSTTIRSFGQYS